MALRHSNVLEDHINSFKIDKNPYAKKVQEAVKDKTLPLLSGSLLKGKKGEWRHSLEKKPLKRLFLEVGSYKGDGLSLMAKKNSEDAFLGVDFTLKRVFLTAKKLYDKKVENACSILADARYLDQFIKEKELDGVIIFFPDPWTKRSQRHKRLISKNFCLILFSLLKPSGFVWVKTDQKDYFEEITKQMKAASFSSLPREERSKNIFFQESYPSCFEMLYLRQKKLIYQELWQKAPN